jgi:hypothetical protein
MKLTKENIIKFLSDSKALLRDRFDVTDIALFGSFARGDQIKDSDIDLLVEMDEPTFSKMAGLRIYLEEKFGREVNILRKHSRLKPRFLKIISRDLIRVT